MTPARAEIRVEQLLAAYPKEEWARAYLNGLADGISWYAVFVENRTSRTNRQHCPPSNLAITPDQHISILRQYVRNRPDSLNDFAGHILIRALAEVFPCR